MAGIWEQWAIHLAGPLILFLPLLSGGLEEVQSEMNAGNIDYIVSKIKYALHPDMFSRGLEEVQIEDMQVT